ncbi:protein VAC14 homolog [Neocloeon triangulifer]|uniref:protein VAC14 homolog n=1 Tax=Neocloeon triangulifer TaxID=2078957 RepID=UPI00286F2743|nr:protein VAC14 homolog [Neocloeon triangulifer]XP_059478480.1 protein VAC14 homolog [Neocloeon triangulifer]
MNDKDYSPLSTACVRALQDKLYEKRKAAAVEIEKMVRDFHASNNTMQIKKLLKILGQDFALSPNPHYRKGGHIGLAAVAIGLGPDCAQYVPELTEPLLASFTVNDARVRYYACEAMHNVAKVARHEILPSFPQVFNALSVLVADLDLNVRSAAELLDRILKDIVTESQTFDLTILIPLLGERIYAKSNFSREFILSWVSLLHQLPKLDLIVYLPELLDGLFKILEDPAPEIQQRCDNVLAQFLRTIKKNPSQVDFQKMINVLILHAQSQYQSLQLTAITWVKEFVQLSGPSMLPYTSSILTAVLPCHSYENEERKNIKETAKAVSFSLLRLVSQQAENPTDDPKYKLDTESVIEVLVRSIGHGSATPSKVAALTWILHLNKKMPSQVSKKLQESSNVLVGALSDPSDEVVRHTLAVLASLSDHSSPGGPEFFPQFLGSLLHHFHSERSVLEERGPFILRQLCVLLNAESIYRSLSQILIGEEDLQFARSMVDCLHEILLTSSELAHLRRELQSLTTSESASLFVCLYKTWCHNPVATVSLCLLTQCYPHASTLIKSFGDLEVTVEFLVELDKLIQLIESPIFAHLRLQLLESPQPLVQSLYGILMLMPQTEAFHTLRRRLNCVPKVPDAKSSSWKEDRSEVNKIDFAKLFSHFKDVQERHLIQRQKGKKNNVLAVGMSLEFD